MPGPESLLIPIGRPLDAEGNIIIEDWGVAPTIRVPVTEETLFSEDDVLLNTATAHLKGEDLPYGAGPNTEPGKPIMFSPPVSATEAPAAAEGQTPADAGAPLTATEAVTGSERVTVTLKISGSKY